MIEIGNWVKPPKGKWHLVESTVADSVITKCGRRMDNDHLESSDVMPLTRMIDQPQLCKAGCDRG